MMTQAKTWNVTSLFSGCGGLDLGFIGGFESLATNYEALPFSVVMAYDNDPKCVETYIENIGSHIQKKDLSDFDPNELPPSDVLIGGFPCQDFSSCGPKKGLESERGRLYRALVSYLDTHKPRIFVAENVPHLARMSKGEVLETIIKDLETAANGYRVVVWKLHAADFGIPQSRTRLFIIGVRKDLPGFPKAPIGSYVGAHRSIDWALKDLEFLEGTEISNHGEFFKASKAKKGNGQGDETSRIGLPAYTVRANAKSRVQFHYRLPRRLTIRECARLQTFPDSFIFSHSATTNIMQIGNAVPPVLAYHVAVSIRDYLLYIENPYASVYD